MFLLPFSRSLKLSQANFVFDFRRGCSYMLTFGLYIVICFSPLILPLNLDEIPGRHIKNLYDFPRFDPKIGPSFGSKVNLKR